MKKKSLLALILTGLLVILGSTFIEAAEPLMVQDMENMQILTPSAPEGGGWFIICDSDEDWYGGVPDFFDSPSVYEDGAIMSSPLPVRIVVDVDPDCYPPELVNIPAGYCVELTFDGGQKKTVYFPQITGDDLVPNGAGLWLPLYVAEDGSTYYDEALTQLAQAAKGIKITITPNKEIYSPGECATFDIEMKRRNRPAHLKKEQIIATFPDKDTQVTLNRVGRGKYIYTTPELTKPGDHTLEVTVYKRGALRSISRLERTKGRIERIIAHLEEVKERLKNPKAVKRLERTIERLRKIINKIGRTIERIGTRGVIGRASSTITVRLVPTIVKEISATDPVDLAVDANRSLYILESSSSYITVYDKDGNYLRGMTTGASYPKGMAVDESGNIYIADTGNNRILKLNSDGNPVTNFGDNGIVTQDFNQPCGIGVDSAGDIYVTDTGNNRIQKFNQTGKFVKMWGSQGIEPGQFNQPKGIFIDGYDHIYVIDSGNNRIQEFSTGGSLYNVWGEAGNGDGQFNLPVDIAASPYYIYVADTGNNRVQKFSEEREFISEIANLNLSNPQGVAIDSDLKKELIYIADTSNNRVIKVELPIIPPEDTWNDMKENLAAGNIEGALTYFSEGSKEKYREYFTELAEYLPRIAQIMEAHTPELIYIKGDWAKYRVRSIEDGEEITYYIYFLKDEEGYWKIDVF